MAFYTTGQNVQTQRQCIKCKQTKALTIQFWDKSVFGSWFVYCKVCYISNQNNQNCNCIKK